MLILEFVIIGKAGAVLCTLHEYMCVHVLLMTLQSTSFTVCVRVPAYAQITAAHFPPTSFYAEIGYVSLLIGNCLKHVHSFSENDHLFSLCPPPSSISTDCLTTFSIYKHSTSANVFVIKQQAHSHMLSEQPITPAQCKVNENTTTARLTLLPIVSFCQSSAADLLLY